MGNTVELEGPRLGGGDILLNALVGVNENVYPQFINGESMEFTWGFEFERVRRAQLKVVGVRLKDVRIFCLDSLWLKK